MTRGPGLIGADELAARALDLMETHASTAFAADHEPRHHRRRGPPGRRHPPPRHPAREDRVTAPRARSRASASSSSTWTASSRTAVSSTAPAGEEMKRFHVHDGLAMVAARRGGPARWPSSPAARPTAVTRRMAELGVDGGAPGRRRQGGGARATMLARLGAGAERGRGHGRRPPGPADDARGGPRARARATRLAEVRRAAHWVSRRRGRRRRGPRGHRDAPAGSPKAWPPRVRIAAAAPFVFARRRVMCYGRQWYRNCI